MLESCLNAVIKTTEKVRSGGVITYRVKTKQKHVEMLLWTRKKMKGVGKKWWETHCNYVIFVS